MIGLPASPPSGGGYAFVVVIVALSILLGLVIVGVMPPLVDVDRETPLEQLKKTSEVQ